jgi:ABC-2 type transport system ATP-binding protein
MQEVEAICKRVIIINKGNIVADDQVDSIRLVDNKQMNLEDVFKTLTN